MSIPSGEHDAGNQNLVADFQRPDFFFGEGEGKWNHGFAFDVNLSIGSVLPFGKSIGQRDESS
jgi:hypothetical protein